ncbi:MAG TPA: helical backbone metal receptor [Candidatus Cybelea sp.]|nr:helical backbone metal receptor [Candidatus Cybelea sp.]
MKRFISIAAALAALATFVAASPSSAPHVRIVALVPSFVEDLFAIGAGSQVVGVSVYGNDVPGAEHIPVVADFSSVDSEKIVALHPDLVLGIPAQGRLLDALQRAGIDVVLLKDDSYGDIFLDLTVIGDLSGHSREAGALTARLSHETDTIRAKTRSFKHVPSVFVALGTGPIWTVGPKSYIAKLIELAGGRNAASDLPEAYGQYSAEALLRAQPDAIVTDRAVHLETVLDREPWRSLRAVQQHHIFIVDPAAILERPGPGYTEGLRWLVERLTPLAQ